jgi:hypothetical protein
MSLESVKATISGRYGALSVQLQYREAHTYPGFPGGSQVLHPVSLPIDTTLSRYQCNTTTP